MSGPTCHPHAGVVVPLPRTRTALASQNGPIWNRAEARAAATAGFAGSAVALSDFPALGQMCNRASVAIDGWEGVGYRGLFKTRDGLSPYLGAALALERWRGLGPKASVPCSVWAMLNGSSCKWGELLRQSVLVPAALTASLSLSITLRGSA